MPVQNRQLKPDAAIPDEQVPLHLLNGCYPINCSLEDQDLVNKYTPPPPLDLDGDLAAQIDERYKPTPFPYHLINFMTLNAEYSGNKWVGMYCTPPLVMPTYSFPATERYPIREYLLRDDDENKEAVEPRQKQKQGEKREREQDKQKEEVQVRRARQDKEEPARRVRLEQEKEKGKEKERPVRRMRKPSQLRVVVGREAAMIEVTEAQDPERPQRERPPSSI